MIEKLNNIELICKKAKDASYKLAVSSNKERNIALKLIANQILKSINKIITANRKDYKAAKKNKIPSALLDRLLLNEERIKNMAKDVNNISKLEDPIGKELIKKLRPNGLKITKVSVPLGVIAVIFESRPNVACDVACLCIKSGNAVILKGGKEAKHTNEIIIEIIKNTLKKTSLNANIVSSLKNYSRTSVNQLLKMDKYIDVLVPRGGKELIKTVRKNSNIPVFSHLDGICHTYIDKFANEKMAINITYNAKMRRTSICGATETILCHKDVAKQVLPHLLEKLLNAGCEVRGDSDVASFSKKIKKASEQDWKKEYLDSIVSIKVVKSLNEAIKHINNYSSKHTDAIITNNKKNAKLFLTEIESAIVMHNTSTQFSDGAEFGLGAEIGISTGKLHARGTSKYSRADYL